MTVQIAQAFRALADLAATEGSIRSALVAWPARSPAELCRPLERLSARLRLGAPLAHAVGTLAGPLGPEAEVLRGIVHLHLSSGAAVSPLLRAAADRLTARAEARARLAAGLAGVRASARLVASLPFVCLVLLPLDRSAVSDPIGVVLLACGTVLAVAGFIWMRRLSPGLAALDDPIAELAELAAAALKAGAPLMEAFELASLCPLGAERAHVERALRLGRLGGRWASALALTGHPPLEDLGRVVGSATSTGAPLAPALGEWARARRRVAEIDADRAIKRAPVRMVLPLTLCVLPAFVLVGLGPFLRGLARIA